MARVMSSASNVQTKEREYDDNLLDMIDKKLSSNTEPAVKSAMKKFDNSHTTEELNKVYDDLDMEAFINNSRDSIPVVKEQPVEKKVVARNKNIDNPFANKNHAIEHTNYSEVVADTVAPKMEIKSYTPVRPAKRSLSARIKLWLVTGICCLVLIGGSITAAALNLGGVAGSKAVVLDNFATETTELASENGIINKTGQDLSSETISQIQNGSVSSSVGENIVTKSSVSTITPSTSVWDKISAFIAHLFGR